MSQPEKPSHLEQPPNASSIGDEHSAPQILEDDYTRYCDGLKGYRNKVVDFDFIMRLKADTTFGDFLEGIKRYGIATDYAGFHVFDPNWYDQGKYRTGVMNPELWEKLENHFRRRKLLEEDQQLEPTVSYTIQPRGRYDYWTSSELIRADMVIDVSGGENDSCGQFITVWFDDKFSPFELNEDIGAINNLKRIARETGKQEISRDQAWKEVKERRER